MIQAAVSWCVLQVLGSELRAEGVSTISPDSQHGVTLRQKGELRLDVQMLKMN